MHPLFNAARPTFLTWNLISICQWAYYCISRLLNYVLYVAYRFKRS